MNIDIIKKQQQFIDSTAFEVLYGGAAGGGKSWGQLIDALLYAVKYTGSRQLMLRRKFPELERSLIRVSRSLYPREICTYNEAKHVYTFKNKSIIEFGYCDTEKDVFQYQSAEYDVIRFDELTHFTEFMYIYLISRCRGANGFPKHIKSTSNPGGVGHQFVKQVNDVMHGDETYRALVIGKTPQILQKHGAKMHDITIAPSDIRKLAYPEGYMGGYHNLGFHAIEQIPQQLHDPVAVIESATQPKSQVIFTELLDTHGNPVMIALHLDKNGKLGITNEVASMYGRKGFTRFIEKQRAAGRVLYEKEKRANTKQTCGKS